MSAAAIGAVVFVLAFLGFSELAQPCMPGKPWPPMDLDFSLVARVAAALVVAALCAVYMYRTWEYQPQDMIG